MYVVKIISEMKLADFGFSSGGKDHADLLSSKQLNDIESVIDDIFPNGITATELNDLFWFDFDAVLEWIGTTYEELVSEDSETEGV